MVGKPGTGIGVTTCAQDPLADDPAEDILCSLDNVIRMRTKGGKNPFTNVTDELLSMTVCTDAPCEKRNDFETIEIFDADYYNFFWNWNTLPLAGARSCMMF